MHLQALAMPAALRGRFIYNVRLDGGEHGDSAGSGALYGVGLSPLSGCIPVSSWYQW